ncbi:nuclear transport factor 2 family protein [Pusillimonas sp.]|uniref:nuclear transport factor 2 family protein n=1 Tax=Pusillimonas sp. TaxID=3040095 RepID=UPI0037CAC19F
MITIIQTKSAAAVIALAASMSIASISFVLPAKAQSIGDAQSAASLSVVMEFLSNTTPDKVEAAAKRLVAPNATYVSLNFDNPELKKILPWTGTNKGPKAYSSVFMQVGHYWKIEDFAITDKIASGEDVAIFGKFTYRSVTMGDVFTSPFSILAKVRDGKMIYFQFMEDTYASASSFRQSGSWTLKTTEDTAAFSVGAE